MTDTTDRPTETTVQSAPTPGFAAVEPFAIDVLARIAREQYAKGLAEYGTPLMAGNGRDALMDAMTEAHDLTRYITQAMLEQERDKEIIRQMTEHAKMLRAAMNDALDSMEAHSEWHDMETGTRTESWGILIKALEKRD